VLTAAQVALVVPVVAGLVVGLTRRVAQAQRTRVLVVVVLVVAR
jgi:hypothetical protein